MVDSSGRAIKGQPREAPPSEGEAVRIEEVLTGRIQMYLVLRHLIWDSGFLQAITCYYRMVHVLASTTATSRIQVRAFPTQNLTEICI